MSESGAVRAGGSAPGMEAASAVALAELVAYADGSIVSRTLVQSAAGSVTLFAFDAGQQLSEHTSPFGALALVVDGSAELVIGGKPVVAESGQAVLMPADVPHAVNARHRFKMLLTMIKNPAAAGGR